MSVGLWEWKQGLPGFLITLQKRTWKKPNIHFQPGNSKYYRAVESLACKHPILQVHDCIPQSRITTIETIESELESRRCVVFITTFSLFAKHLVKLKFPAVLFQRQHGMVGSPLQPSTPGAQTDRALYLVFSSEASWRRGLCLLWPSVWRRRLRNKQAILMQSVRYCGENI